ncbi:unnamed protein product [Paramecium pentaurelia]|uniref:Uncharacterized protein n=1 Tax=Paramecium pentaurelia TaxID=43138 RepID=A0A8S1V987_9CILI|nr:unnamed protein product [Paramecium pentaurelia]
MSQYQSSDPYEFLHYCNQQDQQINDQNKLFIENLVIYDVKYQIHHHKTVLQIFNEQNQVLKTLWGFQDVQFPTQSNLDQIIKDSIESNLTQTVYSQTYPGGQLFKIGYQQEVDAWLIYCNNLTIVAQTSNDLSEYQFQRFDSAVQVAELWFNILNEFSQEKLNNLKFDLQNRTVYGHIINQESLIYHPNDILQFIGIIDVNFEQAQQLFCFYGLPHPKTSQFKLQLKVLQKHIERIQRSDIELESGGVILYFNDQYYVVHTAEYLIYKHIQSMLLNEQHIERDFKQFLKSLQVKPPRPFKFYQNIYEEGIKILESNNKIEQTIKYNFNDFITIILYNIFNNKTFKWNQLKSIKEYRVSWSSYQPESLKRIPVYTGEDLQKNPENVYLIIPVGVNGVGVSTFASTFQSFYYQTQIVSDIQDAKIRDNYVIIIEHNHTPEEAQSILSKCSQFYNKIILYPYTKKSYNQLKLPFSYELLITAMKRTCTTLERVQLFIKKAKTFQNFNVSSFQVNGIIEFPFVDEDLKIDHQYIEDDLLDLFSNESKKNLNQFFKSLKELHLQNQSNETYDDEIKNIIHYLFPKVTNISKHQPIKVDDVVRKESEDVVIHEKKTKLHKKDKHIQYDPTYLPNSLSFQLKGGYNMKDKINKWILDCLNAGNSHFKNDETYHKIVNIFQKQTFENGEQHFIPEKELKLELLTINQNDQSVRQLPYFKDFIQDKEAEIFVKTLFVSFDGLIAALANQSALPCQSPYPHIPFYFKNLKGKDSQSIISQTILQNQILKQAFKDGQLSKVTNQPIFASEDIKYRNKTYKIYVISLQDGIKVNAISTDRL